MKEGNQVYTKQVTQKWDTKLEQIKQQIRNLRDANFHVCPAHDDDSQECTCEKFDLVIDEIDKL